MLSTLPSFIGVPCALLCGKIAGRKVSYRCLAIAGAVLSLVCGIAPAFTNSFALLLLWRALFGMGHGIITPLLMPMVMANFEGEAIYRQTSMNAMFTNIGAVVFQMLGGVAFCPCSSFIASLLLNGWFKKRRSFVCSVVMAGTGVGGMLWGIIVPALVQRYTYRAGYWFCSVTWLVLMLMCGALTIGLPRDVGVQPYGGEIPEDVPAAVPAPAERRGLLLQPRFWLLCTAIFFLSFVNSFYPHTQAFLVNHSYSSVAAGRVVSLFSIALVVFKLLLGVHFERRGLRNGIVLPAAVDFAALFLLFAGGPSLLAPAVILFAANSSLVSMTPLLSAGQIYNPQEFAALWGILSSVGSVGNTVGSPLWGLLYDLSGSYQMGFAAAIVLLGAWLLICRYLLGGIQPQQKSKRLEANQ